MNCDIALEQDYPFLIEMHRGPGQCNLCEQQEHIEESREQLRISRHGMEPEGIYECPGKYIHMATPEKSSDLCCEWFPCFMSQNKTPSRIFKYEYYCQHNYH